VIDRGLDMMGWYHMIGRIVCMVIVFTFVSAATGRAGDQTFVNSREVVSKQSDGKTVAAFPDVAKTPESPSGPVPIPYPNMGRSTDTAKGSKKVKVDGNPIMMKKSSFGRSSGDEPGGSEPSTGTKKLESPPKQVGLKNEQDLKKESEQNQRP